MNIINAINNAPIYTCPSVDTVPREGRLRDLCRRARNERAHEEYSGVGTLFKENAGIRRIFEHHHVISGDNVSYLQTKKEDFSIARKVFDYTIGTFFTSAVEALFHLARAVYHIGKAIITYFKVDRGKNAAEIAANLSSKDYAVKALSDFTQAIKHVIKMIPLVGSLIGEYVFDAGRYLTTYALLDKSVLDRVEATYSEFPEFRAGSFADEEIEAIFQKDALTIEEREKIRMAQLTADEACFETSEVKRIVIALESHTETTTDHSITLGYPMRALQGILDTLHVDLDEHPTTIDFTKWEGGAFEIMPDKTKAKLALLSFFLKRYPDKMAKVVNFSGVNLEELFVGAIEFGSDDVVKWLLEGARKDVVLPAIMSEITVGMFTRKKTQHADDPVMLKALDHIWKLTMTAISTRES